MALAIVFYKKKKKSTWDISEGRRSHLLSYSWEIFCLTEFLVPVVTRQNERVKLPDQSSPAHTQKGPERQWRRDTPNNTLSMPTPAAINPEEHRGTTAGRGHIQIQDSERRESCLGFVQGCPSRTSVPMSTCENLHHGSLGATLWAIFWTKDGPCLGVGHTTRCRARTF